MRRVPLYGSSEDDRSFYRIREAKWNCFLTSRGPDVVRAYLTGAQKKNRMQLANMLAFVHGVVLCGKMGGNFLCPS